MIRGNCCSSLRSPGRGPKLSQWIVGSIMLRLFRLLFFHCWVCFWSHPFDGHVSAPRALPKRGVSPHSARGWESSRSLQESPKGRLRNTGAGACDTFRIRNTQERAIACSHLAETKKTNNQTTPKPLPIKFCHSEPAVTYSTKADGSV